jgi:hypothetical protein
MGALGLAGGIPPEIGMLMDLWNLNLSMNQLGGSIPSKLGNLFPLLVLCVFHFTFFFFFFFFLTVTSSNFS